MSKDTTIISDLRSFFSENENNRAIDAIMRVMECINIRPSQIGTEKKGNCRFTNVHVLNLLMLFPFFVVRNAYRYSGSSLSRLFCCEKDMFYRFMNDGNIKWRKLLFDFGKCQSVHFSAQIASFTLTMMQYNILCTVKRFEAYETNDTKIGIFFEKYSIVS